MPKAKTAVKKTATPTGTIFTLGEEVISASMQYFPSKDDLHISYRVGAEHRQEHIKMHGTGFTVEIKAV